MENGVKLANKLVYKVLFNSPEDVFQGEYLESLQKDPAKKDSLKKTVQKNRYNFIIMLRVIIDQGYMMWFEGISYFGPMFRDRLEIYHIKEDILNEFIETTHHVEISFFLGVYLYLFFVVPRHIK